MGLSIELRKKLIDDLYTDLSTIARNFAYACGSKLRPEAKERIAEEAENVKNLCGLLVDVVATFIPASRTLKGISDKIFSKYVGSITMDSNLFQQILEQHTSVALGITQEVFKAGAKSFLDGVYPNNVTIRQTPY
jgi:hypothetical protein